MRDIALVMLMSNLIVALIVTLVLLNEALPLFLSGILVTLSLFMTPFMYLMEHSDEND